MVFAKQNKSEMISENNRKEIFDLFKEVTSLTCKQQWRKGDYTFTIFIFLIKVESQRKDI